MFLKHFRKIFYLFVIYFALMLTFMLINVWKFHL
jgi:hypothetical protein